MRTCIGAAIDGAWIGAGMFFKAWGPSFAFATVAGGTTWAVNQGLVSLSDAFSKADKFQAAMVPFMQTVDFQMHIPAAVSVAGGVAGLGYAFFSEGWREFADDFFDPDYHQDHKFIEGASYMVSIFSTMTIVPALYIAGIIGLNQISDFQSRKTPPEKPVNTLQKKAHNDNLGSLTYDNGVPVLTLKMA